MSEISAAQMLGPTATFTANTSGSVPAPIQVTGSGNNQPQGYVITNTGTVIAFVTCEALTADASANAVVPTGSGSNAKRVHVIPPNNFQCSIKGPPNAFFTGITESSTARIMVTPVEGV